ncbi:MAG: hypothetical protein SFY80_15575 [Verrucomicrobiota bacterium]|nr:hypothetical protein [Verrucomicrobiota bacterium]
MKRPVITSSDPIKNGVNAMVLIEEAVQLLRKMPSRGWLYWAIGVMPFTLSWIVAVFDLMGTARARDYLFLYALVTALCFTLLKGMQSSYCQAMARALIPSHEPGKVEKPSINGYLEQVWLQTSSLLALSIGVLITLPYPWLQAYYTNLCVLTALPAQDESSLHQRAIRQAGLWVGQNTMLLTLLFAVMIVVFMNCIIAIIGLPWLVKLIFGVEVLFTAAPVTLYSGKFIVSILLIGMGLTWALTDPLVKAIYLLRCYYGESQLSGLDLHQRWTTLRRLRTSAKSALIVFIIALVYNVTPGNLMAQPAVSPQVEPEIVTSSLIPPDVLNATLEQELSKAIYDWRTESQEVSSSLVSMSEWIRAKWKEIYEGSWLERFMKWIEDLLKSDKKSEEPISRKEETPSILRTLAPFLYLIAVFGLIFLLYKLVQHRLNPAPVVITVATAVTVKPDLESSDTHAEAMSLSGWHAYARELAGRGEYRLAMRALFFAQLSQLADRGVIVLQRHKTNADYNRDINKRGHSYPGLYALFSTNMHLIERVWYGTSVADANGYQAFEENVTKQEELIR